MIGHNQATQIVLTKHLLDFVNIGKPRGYYTGMKLDSKLILFLLPVVPNYRIESHRLLAHAYSL